MRRSRKIILIALLSIVVLAGTIGGVALAQTDEGTSQTPTLLDRVTTILNEQGANITSDQLQAAFTQAGKEMRDAALDKYLEDLVAQGKITDQQAQDYETWLDSKPADLPFQLGPMNHGGIKPFGGFGRSGGGFRGWCEPPAPAE